MRGIRARSAYQQQPAHISQALNPTTVPARYQVIGTALNGCTAECLGQYKHPTLPSPSISIYPQAKQCLGSTFEFRGEGWICVPLGGAPEVLAARACIYHHGHQQRLYGHLHLSVLDANGCAGNEHGRYYHQWFAPVPVRGGVLSGCVPYALSWTFRPWAAAASSPELECWRCSGKRRHNPTCFYQPGTYPITGQLVDANGCAGTLECSHHGVQNERARGGLPASVPGNPWRADEVLWKHQQKRPVLQLVWGDNAVYATSKPPHYLFQRAGAYPWPLWWKATKGCLDTVVKSIVVEPGFAIYVPMPLRPTVITKRTVYTRDQRRKNPATKHLRPLGKTHLPEPEPRAGTAPTTTTLQTRRVCVEN